VQLHELTDRVAGCLPSLIRLIIFFPLFSHNGADVVQMGYYAVDSEEILDKKSPYIGWIGCLNTI
jgi:hypothetical protein